MRQGSTLVRISAPGTLNVLDSVGPLSFKTPTHTSYGEYILITSNVIHRTFHIRYGKATGTAFAIDRDNKQYLITARHVVKDFASDSTIAISHDGQWKTLPVEVVGIGADVIDVAVLACSIRLAPAHSLVASSEWLTYGQPVYFLGFPFGWNSGMENLNREFPVPFVKAGIVSAIITGDASHIYLDAHGNRGFSGGPVVFVPSGRPSNEFRVVGIVANAPTPRLVPVVEKTRSPLVGDDGEPIAYFPENQGLVVAFDIRHATSLLDANPIGFQLLSD